MRSLPTHFIAVLLALIPISGCGEIQPVEVAPVESKPTPTPIPVDLATRRGPVNDEESAIAIALAAWIPVYGKDEIEAEQPYAATLEKGVWIVEGYLSEGTPGGVAVARISQKDGRVLEIFHGE